MISLSLLHGALDVNGEGNEMRQDGQDASSSFLTARTVPMMTVSPSSTLRVPSAPAISVPFRCGPTAEI